MVSVAVVVVAAAVAAIACKTFCWRGSRNWGSVGMTCRWTQGGTCESFDRDARVISWA